MTGKPFPSRGSDDEEPEGSGPLSAGRDGRRDDRAGPAGLPGRDHGSCNDQDGRPGSRDDQDDGVRPEGGPEEELPADGDAEQGLFWCVPAGAPDLAGFAGDAGAGVAPVAPGPLLAGLTAAVAGGDGAGLAGVSEDFLFAVMSAGRRMVSWGTWLELSAMRELAVRHPAVPAASGRLARRGQPASPAASEAPAPASPAPASPAYPGAPVPASAAPAASGAGAGQSGAAGVDPVAGRVQLSEFAADEVAAGLRLTWTAAADRVLYACDLAGRLPVTFAALGQGLVDPVHARIIFEQTDYLSAADAARADPVLAAAAQRKTYGELRAAAARLVLRLDPQSAQRRRQARRKQAHVRVFREDSGNAGMTARELPGDEVLASWQHVDQRARDLAAAGVPGTLAELRVRAYLDLLQERDARDTLPAPDRRPDANGSPGSPDGPDGSAGGPGGPAGGPDGSAGPGGGNGGNGGSGGPGGSPAPGPGTGPAGRASPGSPGPSLAALVNLTIPLSTATGDSDLPGEAAGFGLLDGETARDLLAAAGRDPRTRWCLTVLHPDGTAAAHGCATGRHPPPPGPEPSVPGPPAPPAPPEGARPCGTGGAPDQRPSPGTRARGYLTTLGITVTPIARGTCDHRHAEAGYRPSRTLRHLITTRSARCTAPGCGRSAARCDLDHTVAWDTGGLTCECDLAPLCRHHHRLKQARGWYLEQPAPGVMVWRTPNGHTYTTTPTSYPI